VAGFINLMFVPEWGHLALCDRLTRKAHRHLHGDRRKPRPKALAGIVTVAFHLEWQPTGPE